MRDLIGVYENDKLQIWANDFVSLLIDMNNHKKNSLYNNLYQASQTFLNYFQDKYDDIISMAKKQNPSPKLIKHGRGRPARGKVLSLVDRLEKYKGAVCLFLNNFNVPFDNNLAERDIRMIKVKSKVSGCFRSNVGCTNYLKIMSFIGTTHKRGFNAFFINVLDFGSILQATLMV